jgi:hypothetical protein
MLSGIGWDELEVSRPHFFPLYSDCADFSCLQWRENRPFVRTGVEIAVRTADRL